MLVFVSYCLRDFPLVKSLILQLGVIGYNVQYEPKMPAGQIRWSHVLESIQACDVVIIALTSHALQSESRALELQYAKRLGKPVLPVLLEDIPGELPADFGQALNYVLPTKQINEQLAQALDAKVRSRPSQTNLELVPTEPEWRIPMMKIHTLTQAQSISLTDQQWVILNIQEFLERQETYRAAKSLLKSFSTRRDTDASIQTEVEETAKQLKNSYVSQRRARIRNIALATMFVLGIMVVGGFFLYRRQQSANRAMEATLTEQAVYVTQTGFVLNNDMTKTAISILETESAHQTETARPTATLTLTPTLTQTPNARFIYESIFTGELLPSTSDGTITPILAASPVVITSDATAANTLSAEDITPTRTLLPPVTPANP